VLCTASRQRPPRVNTRATAERKTHTTPPSKPLLDGYRTRHDIPPEARFARTAVYATTLYVMPPHVDKTVRHAYKLPPAWPRKGGAVPWPQGGRRTTLTRTLSAFTTILALASVKRPLGPGGSTSSPASLVALLCKHHGATQYSASSTPLLDVRPWPELG
jgi:hypothetical protein